jgi:hypothetical protein
MADDVTNMKALIDVYDTQQKRAADVIQHSIGKLQKYKSDKAELPTDCDGIYIIVKGMAKIVNDRASSACLQLEQQSITKKKEIPPVEVLKQFFHFGASRFLKEQSWTYFGSIIACTSESQPSHQNSNSKKKLTNKVAKTETKKLSDEAVTVCMYLPKEKLYLIPFYDLKMLRDEI